MKFMAFEVVYLARLKRNNKFISVGETNEWQLLIEASRT